MPRTSRRSPGHELDSKPRIREACWRPAAAAKAPRGAIDPLRTAGRVPRSCRDRSTVLPIAFQFLHQLLNRHHWMARWRFAGRICRRREPSLTYSALKEIICVAPWRHDLGDNAVAIGDHDRLARRCQANIFAELVLQRLQANHMHVCESSL